MQAGNVFLSVHPSSGQCMRNLLQPKVRKKWANEGKLPAALNRCAM